MSVDAFAGISLRVGEKELNVRPTRPEHERRVSVSSSDPRLLVLLPLSAARFVPRVVPRLGHPRMRPPECSSASPLAPGAPA